MLVVVQNMYQYIKRNKTRDEQSSLPCYPIYILSVSSSKWKHVFISASMREKMKSQIHFLNVLFFFTILQCNFLNFWYTGNIYHHRRATEIKYILCMQKYSIRLQFHVDLPRKIMWLGYCNVLTVFSSDPGTPLLEAQHGSAVSFNVFHIYLSSGIHFKNIAMEFQRVQQNYPRWC